MGRRGPRPKPAPLKLLAGERAGRIPAPAGAPGGVVAPACPDFLDDESRREWGRICGLLAARGTLSEADAPALVLYCNAFSRRMRARRAGDEVLTESASGSLKANPAVAIEAQAEAAMFKILESFGLTQSSASRVPAKVEGPRDEFAELMARRKKG